MSQELPNLSKELPNLSKHLDFVINIGPAVSLKISGKDKPSDEPVVAITLTAEDDGEIEASIPLHALALAISELIRLGKVYYPLEEVKEITPSENNDQPATEEENN